jgi:hypothetical protein
VAGGAKQLSCVISYSCKPPSQLRGCPVRRLWKGWTQCLQSESMERKLATPLMQPSDSSFVIIRSLIGWFDVAVLGMCAALSLGEFSPTQYVTSTAATVQTLACRSTRSR